MKSNDERIRWYLHKVVDNSCRWPRKKHRYNRLMKYKSALYERLEREKNEHIQDHAPDRRTSRIPSVDH